MNGLASLLIVRERRERMLMYLNVLPCRFPKHCALRACRPVPSWVPGVPELLLLLDVVVGVEAFLQLPLVQLADLLLGGGEASRSIKI